MKQFWQELLGYFASGGIVMPPLAIATAILWYALGYRWMVLQRGSPRSPRVLIQRYAKGRKKEPRGTIDSAVVLGIRLLIDLQLFQQILLSFSKQFQLIFQLKVTILILRRCRFIRRNFRSELRYQSFRLFQL